MKKSISKIKKILFTILLTIEGVQNKVLGYTPLYGVQKVKDDKSETIQNVWGVFSCIVIPIVLLIGLIVYFKKSKSSLKKKIIISILVTIFIIILCFIVNYMVKEFFPLYRY